MGKGQKLTLILTSIIFLSPLCRTAIIHFTSSYGLQCYDDCRTDGYDYFWCHTKEGWDYCSVQENIDTRGNTCRDDHPCGKHGYSYYWCYNRWSDDWDKCGSVEHQTEIHLTATYQSVCLDDCSIYENEYYWCKIQHSSDNWDYCSPTYDVTYKNVPCRWDHYCDTHGESYTWCYTDSSWDYCGRITPSEECSGTARQKRGDNNLEEVCSLDDDGNRKTTKISAEVDNNKITDGTDWKYEIGKIIRDWNSNYLRNQAKSNLDKTKHLRLDLQGLISRNNQPYCNFQIQMNQHRRPGESTTVAQVLVPLNGNIPERYVRRAFTESCRRRARVFIDVISW